ncbi:MAG: alpha/beta fold hydrolase [Actinomycetota bacterium]
MPTEVVVSRDGTRIACERTGTGPPLVIVAGALSEHASAAGLVKTLARDLSVISYDRRGRGESGGTPPWSVEDEIDDLRAVAELAVAPVSVYGHSSGGILSIEAALGGLPIPRLVVYEPPYVADRSDPHAPPADLADRLRATLASFGGADATIREFLRLGPGLSEAQIDDLAASPAWQRFLALAPAIPFEAAIVGDGAIPRERLAGLGTPTLVLQGGASPSWVRAATAELAAAIPDGRLVVLEGLDHTGARTDPDRVAAEVVRFVVTQ